MPMMYITEVCYEFKSVLVREIRFHLAFEKARNLHKIYKKYKRQIMEKSSFLHKFHLVTLSKQWYFKTIGPNSLN